MNMFRLLGAARRRNASTDVLLCKRKCCHFTHAPPHAWPRANQKSCGVVQNNSSNTSSSRSSSRNKITSKTSTCFKTTKRLFSSSYTRKHFETICPYEVLGVTDNCDYAVAKRAFLKIAMSHHPDTAAHVADSEEEKELLREVFMKARAAFESIVELPDGRSMRKEALDQHGNFESKEDFNNWFKQETGHANPFEFDLDPAIMLEVAEMTETTGGVGLDRDGGMWHLASLVSNSVKNGQGSSGAILRLDAGEISQDGIKHDKEGHLKKRRRRKNF